MISITLTIASGAKLNVDAGTFVGNYSNGFTTITLDANSIVDYVGSTQAVAPLAYGNLNINSSGVATITADSDVLGTLTEIVVRRVWRKDREQMLIYL